MDEVVVRSLGLYGWEPLLPVTVTSLRDGVVTAEVPLQALVEYDRWFGTVTGDNDLEVVDDDRPITHGAQYDDGLVATDECCVCGCVRDPGTTCPNCGFNCTEIRDEFNPEGSFAALLNRQLNTISDEQPDLRLRVRL